MIEEIRPQVWNVIENFNTDLSEAARDGITMVEATAVAGAISETVIRSIVSENRIMCWQAIVNIMARKFDEGEL